MQTRSSIILSSLLSNPSVGLIDTLQITMEAYRLLVFLWVFLVAIEIPDGAMATEKITVTASTTSEGQDIFVIVMHYLHSICNLLEILSNWCS